jgi:hypothetical protein
MNLNEQIDYLAESIEYLIDAKIAYHESGHSNKGIIQGIEEKRADIREALAILLNIEHN